MTLVAGPTRLDAAGRSTKSSASGSAAEMHARGDAAAAGADVVIMAAAVADYTPAQRAAGKIEKIDAPLTLTLERTPDILADLGATRDALGEPRPCWSDSRRRPSDVVARARAKRAGRCRI